MKKFIILLTLMLASASMATIHTVNLVGSSFSPQHITIQGGDTVRWVKPAGGFHNVAALNPPPNFRSGDPISGAFTYNFAFPADLPGLHPYECEVHGSTGMTGSVTVEVAGTPPAVPSNPIPADNATNFPTLGFLIWESEGTDHSIVQFGTANPPPVVNANVNGFMFPYSNLIPNTEYFWKITAVNPDGETEGPIWSFTTIAPPAQAANPFPSDNATNVPRTTILGWDIADGANEYDISFGTQEPLNQLGVITGTSIDPPGDLLASTTYLWRVNTWNDAGMTPGQLWSFTTEAGSAVGDENLPSAFQLTDAFPNPFNSSVRISLSIAQESQTVLRIFDIVGKEVTKLVDSKLSAGDHQLEWNATGHSAGLYFLKCECAGLSQTQKLIYLP